MSTPYERGQLEGAYTLDMLSGWIVEASESGITDKQELIRRAAQLCLARQEEVYTEEIEKCSRFKPDYAERHRQYMNGLIESARATLGYLMRGEQ